MIKVILIQALLLGFQIIVYFGSEKFQKNPHNVLRKADASIPFLPWTVTIYATWFPLIAVFPPILYLYNEELYYVYLTAMLFDIIVSVIIYVIYPTTFERPQCPDTMMGRLMAFVYKGSYKGLNCAPSLHCSSCFLILFFSFAAAGMPSVLRLVFGVIAFLIVLSTMTTKQHALIDAVTALPMAILSWIVGWIFPLVILAGFVLK